MLAYPRLRPWFEFLVEDGRGARLLSETRQIPLAGPLPAALVPLLTGTLSADQIVDRLAGGFDQTLVYYYLVKLEKLGLLEDGRRPPGSPADSFWGQLAGEPAKLSGPIRLNLTTLGGVDPEPVREGLGRQESFQVVVADWREAQPAGNDPWLVLTPDYLEPELAEFNRLALAQGWRWLPCKPWGIEPCFGPLFTPGESPCLECLLHRLRGHRRIGRETAAESGSGLRLARGHCAASLDAVLGLLGLELTKVLTEAPGAFLAQGAISISLKDPEIVRHQLSRRPQCPVCGDPAGWGRLPEEPPLLQSRSKSSYRDGGERIWDATQTLARHEARISPLTGEVGALQEDAGQSHSPLGHTAIASWAVLARGPRALPIDQEQDWRASRARALGTSAGKGRTRSQARASAIGEALERYSSQFHGYEPRVRATWAQVSERAIHPHRLQPFSASQFRNRLEWCRMGWTSLVPEPFREEEAIDWAPAWSLSEKRWKLVPAAFVYFAYPRERGGRFINADSNGVAAGNCLEEAFMQAFFELVERDAVALWWYNRLRRRAVDQDSFGDHYLREARAHLARLGFSLEVLDLGSDLPVPVLAAVALPNDNPDRQPLLGFGCHHNAQIALRRALGEVSQGFLIPEDFTPLALARDLLGHPLAAADFLRPRAGASLKQAGELTRRASDDFLEDIHQAVEMMAGRGLETLMVDLTRPEIGLSVVRVMIPGLVHFWPRLGAERLYRVPVEQGWLPRALREEELNPLPFYF